MLSTSAKKAKIISSVVIAVLAVASLTAHLIISNTQHDNPVVTVYHKGEVFYGTVHDDFEYEFYDGKIAMLRSTCPNQTCVRMGRSRTLPIICVPNRVEIRIVNQNSDIDGVTR
jgi:hypothetical protein